MRRDDDAELREKGVCEVNGIGRLTTTMASLIIRTIIQTGLEARGDISKVFWACSGKLRCWACMV
jgi:hypothetical protein